MHPLVNLAKKAVESYVKEGKIIEVPEDLPEEFLKRRAGTFVTIEKNGELRGCIGTYLPTRVNIAEEVIRNVIAAASEDYRFEPIKEKELSSLSYIVYILSYPEQVKDIKELDPKKFGIVVKTHPIFFSKNLGGQAGPFTYPDQENVKFNGVIPPKTGLLLPDLEGIETVEQQISIACQKGGINQAREKIFIYKFIVEKYQ